MKSETYFFSDPHFFHARIIDFGRKFVNVDEMNLYMITRWNETVSPQDKVWVLGDCVFAGKENLKIFERLNGTKMLVLGNHDHGDKLRYLEYFSKIEGAVAMDQTLLTHFPVHPSCMEPRFTLNIHGHTHSSLVRDERGNPDPRYVCVSVEQTDYRPVTMEWIRNKQHEYRNL